MFVFLYIWRFFHLSQWFLNLFAMQLFLSSDPQLTLLVSMVPRIPCRSKLEIVATNQILLQVSSLEYCGAHRDYCWGLRPSAIWKQPLEAPSNAL